MASSGGPHGDSKTHLRPLDRRGWLVVALLAAAVVVVSGAVVWYPMPGPSPLTVHASASDVLLNVSDIPDPNWGEWASGSNGTGAWRFFSVHTEIILATLNVTLWVERDANDARQAMDSIARNVSYPVQDGGLLGADSSLLWTFNFGQYGGELVRRYNVVFLLGAHLESSFALTKSDLAEWSGWQLAKIESLAA